MVEAAVFEVIASHIKSQPEAISRNMPLEDLGIDSLGAITILYELEDRYDIEIPNEVFDSLNVVNDIVVHLEQLLEAKASE
ncbi:MAG: acyl carrier protein [Gammaproteobacteria bacterium]|nr:acyl carrier protein [Gammaproteobacteria bacterium]